MTNKEFCYKDISTYRSAIMGWAILWIMMLHFTFTQIKPLGFIAQYGFAGVDLFMFLSGLGIFFSLDKSSEWQVFYKKRLLRIFPTYYLLGIFNSIFIFHDSLKEYFFRYSTLGFWIGKEYGDWYIPSLIFLYLLSPFIKKAIDKKLYVLIGLCILIVNILVIYIIEKEIVLDRAHFFFIYRIPAFIGGMLCAHWIKEGFHIKYYYIILLAGIPLFILLYPHHHHNYDYKYYSLSFLLFSFVYFFTYISKCDNLMTPIMRKIGEASLEIYLIQGMLFAAILQEQIRIPLVWHDAFAISLIILSSITGILIHWLINKSGIYRLL